VRFTSEPAAARKITLAGNARTWRCATPRGSAPLPIGRLRRSPAHEVFAAYSHLLAGWELRLQPGCSVTTPRNRLHVEHAAFGNRDEVLHLLEAPRRERLADATRRAAARRLRNSTPLWGRYRGPSARRADSGPVVVPTADQRWPHTPTRPIQRAHGSGRSLTASVDEPALPIVVQGLGSARRHPWRPIPRGSRSL